MRIAIFGCGGLGRELLGPVKRHLATLGALRSDLEDDPPGDVVFVADQPTNDVLGTRVIHPEDLTEDDRLIIAIGESPARQRIAERLSHIRAFSLFAPTALIGPGATIGDGAVFCDNTMVTADARIGRHFQCNIYSYVAHDCVIGDFVTFAPRVCCNGNVHIEDGAYVGAGAIIKQGSIVNPVVIGAGATVGMGAIVTRSVPAGVTVIGNPARVRE